jgi:hypothetical protein
MQTWTQAFLDAGTFALVVLLAVFALEQLTVMLSAAWKRGQK